MFKNLPVTVLILAVILSTAFADVYMHNMRGSNDRNCERNVNRNNGNRLFDSQNNAKGGYACPRAVAGQDADKQTQTMYYYVGEKIPLEWTNQHGGGDNKNLHSEVILQYACTDTLDPTGQFNAADGTVGTPRDGIPNNGNDAATDQIPDNVASATPNTAATKRFGMHESYAYYQECQRTERNKGLFTSDQNLNRNDARATRQNNNGNRNGLECPEERDYYPYWRPSPWRDIAVITSDYSQSKLEYYQNNSQNVAAYARGMCQQGSSAAAQADFTQKRQQRDWYNNRKQCVDNGHNWVRTQYAPDFNGKPSPPMEVVQGEYSRVNQLGNGAAEFTALTAEANCGEGKNQQCMVEMCTDHATKRYYRALRTVNGATESGCATGESTNTFKTWDGRVFDAHFGNSLGATAYPFQIPNTPNKNCVLRLRYNITTYDYPAWANGNRYLDTVDSFTGAPGIDSTANCRGDNANNDQPCTAYSFPAMTQDPYVRVGENNEILSLALNTNQYSRTFQDRSYVFEIRERPDGVAATTSIISMSVRGKRGNIVQTYPAVEYDFAPSQLTLGVDDQVHAQWTGSDYNPQRGCNNGEGGPPDCQGCDPFSQQAINAANQNSRADRSNLVFTDAVGYNAPLGAEPTDTVDLLQTKITEAKNLAKTPFSGADVWKLAYINQDAPGSPLKEAGLSCLTQQQLNNINNNNQRENHPQNCAKLNAAVKPYFDGGLMRVARRGNFAGMSTRNNNFSNRDMRMNICVKQNFMDLNEATCKQESSGDVPKLATFAVRQAKTRNAPQPGPSPSPPINQKDPPANTEETIAPIEKDNDAVGDGEKEACEARILNFLMQIGLWGIIAISVAMIMLGSLGTILVQRVYDRHKKGKMERNEWMDKGGETI